MLKDAGLTVDQTIPLDSLALMGIMLLYSPVCMISLIIRGSLVTESEFKHLLEIEAFPPLPEVASKFLKVPKELGAPIKAIAELLQADPPLLNKILTVINSPFYQASEPISKIEQTSPS